MCRGTWYTVLVKNNAQVNECFSSSLPSSVENRLNDKHRLKDKCRQEYGEIEPLHTVDRNEKWCSHYGKYGNPSKINNRISI